MNLTRLLGVITLTISISVLLSELAIGQQRLLELTGIPFSGLRPLVVLSVVLGLAALYVGVHEERDAQLHHDQL